MVGSAKKFKQRALLVLIIKLIIKKASDGGLLFL